MKANELMIGDWVQVVEPCKYAGATGRVKTLIDHKDDENAYFKVFLKNNTIHIGVEDICSDDIRPIPLTQEILEKNGWIKDGYFYKAKDGSYIQLGELFEHASFRAEKHGIPREIQTSPHLLKYIHQLQHALRLCGIEKEIEL